MSVQFTRRYDWSVTLGYAGTPSIRFVTDPLGAREVFRLRDIPEGKSRRAALLHWVTEHWRRPRRTDAAAVKVERHVRGAETFVWTGLRCRIVPSDYDRERLIVGGAQ